MTDEQDEAPQHDAQLLRELQAGEDLPLVEVFAELAAEWHRRNPGTRSKDLAALLGVRPQLCSQWKTGTDDRRPPWSAIVLLCHLCRRQVVVRPDGLHLAQLRRQRTA
jgi:hypothetical protein